LRKERTPDKRQTPPPCQGDAWGLQWALRAEHDDCTTTTPCDEQTTGSFDCGLTCEARSQEQRLEHCTYENSDARFSGTVRKSPELMAIHTTLYDLSAALSAEVGPDEADVVTAAVMHLLVVLQMWTFAATYAMPLISDEGACHGTHSRPLSLLSERSGYQTRQDQDCQTTLSLSFTTVHFFSAKW
jgi:hypothetical protein